MVSFTAKTWKVFGTLPTGYAPTTKIFFTPTRKGGAIDTEAGEIRTNGDIAMYSERTGTYWTFSVSYPV